MLNYGHDSDMTTNLMERMTFSGTFECAKLIGTITQNKRPGLRDRWWQEKVQATTHFTCISFCFTHFVVSIIFMARRRIKNALIANDCARKTSYMKRKKSLMKMVKELCTLCSIEACAIVYSPYHCEPEIWPSESGVLNVVQKFRTLPEWMQTKKMLNQESFIAQSILKGDERIRNLVKENKETEMTMFMYQCLNTGMIQPGNNMNTTDLNDLSSIIEHKLKEIGTRLDSLNVDEIIPYQLQMPILASQLAMQTPAYNPQMQTLPYQPQPQMQTLPYQPQPQPQMHNQTLPYQLQMQTLPYQPQPEMQTQTLPYQPQVQTQTLPYQSQLQTQTLPYQPQPQMLNYDHGSDTTANLMESDLFLDFLN
ncbi:Agamous-like MADS-box protein AGL80, partial [Mucuna pruriens]